MKLIILSFFIALTGLSQQNYRGKILADSNGTAIPFASIGINGKPIGTLSNEKGDFEFFITPSLKNDSLMVFAIGYKPISFLVSEFITQHNRKIILEQLPNLLEEVNVEAKKINFDFLGNTNYTKNNCSGFVKNTSNWKGSEAAILAGNKVGRSVTLESFSFYVIQNKYTDSLKFRLMFYEASDKKWPRYKTFLRKPIFFKVGVKQGEFTLNLKNYNIITSKDFFISLECLMDEVDISKFCYAGSNSTPSFVKTAAFDRWNKTKGGGGDFNVKVSYVK
jgi:CarboxypepD_reg-like domain